MEAVARGLSRYNINLSMNSLTKNQNLSCEALEAISTQAPLV
jgi:hypothetical protein